MLRNNLCVFQSTHPQGVRLIGRNNGVTFNCVSIHAPTRGATQSEQRKTASALFQSTHPQGVRPLCLPPFLTLAVSIHAPTRGATKSKLSCQVCLLFQSTHPQGVRPVCFLCPHLTSISFNPRTHKGCDEHSSANCQDYCSFNPRTHKGCDVLLPNTAFISDVFQSTHPQGVRL